MKRNLSAAQQYGSMDLQSKIDHANPHQLIQMLIDGAIVRIKAAEGHMQRNEVAQKGEMISKAIAIINGLRNSVDMNKGGEIAANLDDLYAYMEMRLLQANNDNVSEHLTETLDLLNEIKSAWDSIENTPEASTFRSEKSQTAAQATP